MINPTARPTPAPGAEGWTVIVDLPPTVRWITLNQRVTTRDGAAARRRHAQTIAGVAYNALMRHRLPTGTEDRPGLDRIFLQVEYRFRDRRGQEPSNFEPTLKIIIDRLRPQRQHVQKGELIVELGIGMVADDKPDIIVRGAELPPGPPLGRKYPGPGQVILHIWPLPH